VDGVRAAHDLKVRSSGGLHHVQVHIEVEPTITVAEGHEIANAARDALIAECEAVTEVLVHIDPEDDRELAT
jgi:divalent metal cation (Fe/Co/Zn/Cd) transporter